MMGKVLEDELGMEHAYEHGVTAVVNLTSTGRIQPYCVGLTTSLLRHNTCKKQYTQFSIKVSKTDAISS